LGKAIRAVAADRLAAQFVGIVVALTIAITFFLASALGALAGIYYGLEFGSAIQFDKGRASLRGTGRELLAKPAVIQAHLGVAHA
jgi:branched-subunit amino acid ABC-type transport system permease component